MNKEQKALIMSVDDDEIIRKLLEKLIINAGWDVVVAGNGQNALEKIKKTIPDVTTFSFFILECNRIIMILWPKFGFWRIA